MISTSAVAFIPLLLLSTTNAYSIPTRSSLRSLGQATSTISSSATTTKHNGKSTLTMEGTTMIQYIYIYHPDFVPKLYMMYFLDW